MRFNLTVSGFRQAAKTSEPWEVCYFVEPANHYFTAVFESGEVKGVTVDG